MSMKEAGRYAVTQQVIQRTMGQSDAALWLNAWLPQYLAQHNARLGRASGAALDAAIGPHSGKGTGELGLVRRLLQGFRPGDVVLADALYCNYFLIATLMGAGVDVLFEQNGSRSAWRLSLDWHHCELFLPFSHVPVE